MAAPESPAHLRLSPGSGTPQQAFTTAHFLALAAFQDHSFVGVKPYLFIYFVPRESIWQSFQDCCWGRSVPIAPSLLAARGTSVIWLLFPRVSNLSKRREFSLDKGRGTVIEELLLPVPRCAPPCPSRPPPSHRTHRNVWALSHPAPGGHGASSSAGFPAWMQNAPKAKHGTSSLLSSKPT